jgi:hypothetical protein
MGKCRCERMDKRMIISVILFAGMGVLSFIMAIVFREHYFQYMGIGIGFIGLSFLARIVELLDK